ncbi:hypothetical protein [Pontibacter russatus]|uniref:hypothetical protein n=1 Tax=Pontibacter russatus TaxID=2694929 RepID=UPI00137AA793|nr:hypothetical protein [Pontibacter russatus]
MKQLSPLLLLLLLLPAFSFAQTNYKPGLVVTTAGDTLHGLIDYREWDQNPKVISFRASANSGATQEFDPSTSRYFEITGMEVYQSYEGPVSMGRVDKDNLSYKKADTTAIIGRIFLDKRQDGPKAALYSYKDGIKERFFLLEKGENKPQELLYRRYFKATNSAEVVTQRFYVGQLLNVARHKAILTEKLQREIESAAYKEQDLLRVIGKLNGLSVDEVETARKSKIATNFFAGIAFSRGTIAIYGQDHFADADENTASYMPRVAFGLDTYLNENVQKLVLRLEGSLTNANHRVRKTQQTGGGGYDELIYKVVQQTASLSPQIIYNLYNKESLKFYLGAGLALNYSHYSQNNYQRQHFYGTQAGTVYEKEAYKVLLPVWSSYTVRAGVVLNRKYEISAMYLAPGTITRYTSSEVATGSTNVGVNYLFRD